MNTDVNSLLKDMQRGNWQIQPLGPSLDNLDMLVAVYDWPQDQHFDVVKIVGEDEAFAWRVFAFSAMTNPLAPKWVSWCHSGDAVGVLETVTGLPDPDSADFGNAMIPITDARFSVPEKYHDQITRPTSGTWHIAS
ncbi:hypothetical protein ALI144C_16410 [Actinosynnema sp. ALI-1.44]|uniref:hypothetical protein n=1 Tax=Actinosynnema sp. ALI-1.44 TaxID=1933779 RepID=UPI00097C7FB8|nr:hypothetical protein [Actinosynnema sp. ALI-1.44]ONI84243.1 hypothetical protein ALI144C_16410 [Actinosynnema sp. ALI-1.44]